MYMKRYLELDETSTDYRYHIEVINSDYENANRLNIDILNNKKFKNIIGVNFLNYGSIYLYSLLIYVFLTITL